jgi:hypothetical protein
VLPPSALFTVDSFPFNLDGKDQASVKMFVTVERSSLPRQNFNLVSKKVFMRLWTDAGGSNAADDDGAVSRIQARHHRSQR